MPDFDPYAQWLGIRPEDRPVNHYRLLGIELFESAPPVITRAAEARTTLIKGFQSGANGATARQILAELAAAKTCLLDPQQKAMYDAAMQGRLAARAAATSILAMDLMAMVSPEVETPPAPIEEPPPAPSLPEPKAHRSRWIAAAAGFVAVLGLLGWWLSG